MPDCDHSLMAVARFFALYRRFWLQQAGNPDPVPPEMIPQSKRIDALLQIALGESFPEAAAEWAKYNASFNFRGCHEVKCFFPEDDDRTDRN